MSSPWEPPSPGHTQMPLWPGAVPDARVSAGPERADTTEHDHLVAGRVWTYVSNVSRPTLTVYSPAGANTGAAVVVFPGGGYQILAIDLEGTEVCDWLTAKGITCVLLKYRVPRSGPSWQRDCNCRINPKPQPALEDAQRAIGLVRLHAAEWHIDPHKVGVLGFSAGGHLVAAISNSYEKRLYRAMDAADRESCRPDFAVALYPGHLWMPGARELAFNPTFTSRAGPRPPSSSRPRPTASTTSTSRSSTTSRSRTRAFRWRCTSTPMAGTRSACGGQRIRSPNGRRSSRSGWGRSG